MRYIKQLLLVIILVILLFWPATISYGFETDAIEFRITELFSTNAIVLNFETEADLKTTLTFTGGIGRHEGHTFFVFGYGSKYYFSEILKGLYTGISLEFTTNKESRRYDLGVLGYKYAEIRKSVDLNIIGKLGYTQFYQEEIFINYEADLIIASTIDDPKIYLGLLLSIGKRW